MSQSTQLLELWATRCVPPSPLAPSAAPSRRPSSLLSLLLARAAPLPPAWATCASSCVTAPAPSAPLSTRPPRSRALLALCRHHHHHHLERLYTTTSTITQIHQPSGASTSPSGSPAAPTSSSPTTTSSLAAAASSFKTSRRPGRPNSRSSNGSTSTRRCVSAPPGHLVPDVLLAHPLTTPCPSLCAARQAQLLHRAGPSRDELAPRPAPPARRPDRLVGHPARPAPPRPRPPPPRRRDAAALDRVEPVGGPNRQERRQTHGRVGHRDVHGASSSLGPFPLPRDPGRPSPSRRAQIHETKASIKRRAPTSTSTLYAEETPTSQMSEDEDEEQETRFRNGASPSSPRRSSLPRSRS